MSDNSFTLLQMLGGLEKKADSIPSAAAAAESSATESKGALDTIKDFGAKARNVLNDPNSSMNSWIRGEKLKEGNWYRNLWGKLRDALPAEKDAYRGFKGILPRLGRSVVKRPGKAGLIGTGLTGLGMLGAAVFGNDDESGLSALNNISSLNDIPEEWRTPLITGAVAVPVLGAAAGGLSGSGMLRGAAKGLGALGGGYLGYQGGKYLADYLSANGITDRLGSQGKSLVNLASILGGTALGGLGGSSVAGTLVPKGV